VSDRDDGQLIVPWKSVVALVEVPAKETCDILAAVAQLSGNDVVAIGYDCIPIVSADMVPVVEPNRFVRYLTVVKHARRVAAISSSAMQEFQGFADMLPLQGVAGPAVVECALPADVSAASRIPRAFGEPSIVCVGSFEPRKNQSAVLYAAEALWREGLRFRVRFIGSGGSDASFARRLRHLQDLGRPVTTESAVSEVELVEAYREARFSVFVSTHEGYGLPVAESLAFGTPVITGDYGSTREISRDGGAVLVNPRDDDDLVAAMRELLLDDDRLQVLLAEIDARPARSWDDYARELWAVLVDPGADTAPTRPGLGTVKR
jgi:glycosyltransferase involved in cell wall biosynthesis